MYNLWCRTLHIIIITRHSTDTVLHSSILSWTSLHYTTPTMLILINANYNITKYGMLVLITDTKYYRRSRTMHQGRHLQMTEMTPTHSALV